MAKGSLEAVRIGQIVEAMRENGPMSISQLVVAIGWGHESIRKQLRKSSELFEQVTVKRCAPGVSAPGMFYLTGIAANLSEEEMDRRTDDRFRDFKWWPSADQVIISAFRAMVKTGEQTWQQ